MVNDATLFSDEFTFFIIIIIKDDYNKKYR